MAGDELEAESGGGGLGEEGAAVHGIEGNSMVWRSLSGITRNWQRQIQPSSVPITSPNVNRKRLEALLHTFTRWARWDFELKDRFGFEGMPREWFLAPFAVIEEAAARLGSGSIASDHHDPEAAEIVPNRGR